MRGWDSLRRDIKVIYWGNSIIWCPCCLNAWICKVKFEIIWPYKSLIYSYQLIINVKVLNLSGYSDVTHLIPDKICLRTAISPGYKTRGSLWINPNYIMRINRCWTQINLQYFESNRYQIRSWGGGLNSLQSDCITWMKN